MAHRCEHLEAYMTRDLTDLLAHLDRTGGTLRLADDRRRVRS